MIALRSRAFGNLVPMIYSNALAQGGVQAMQGVFPLDFRPSVQSKAASGDALDLVRLRRLMEVTAGKPEVVVGLIDGPVLMDHPDLATENIRAVPGISTGACVQAHSVACLHGTYVAGILHARRGTPAPAICPGCTLLLRPIFPEKSSGLDQMPSTTPEELAVAIIDCVRAGAHVINLSLGLARVSSAGERDLDEALHLAAKRGVIVVAAAGNQGTIGSSALTRHPWVIPVVACDGQANVLGISNLGNSIGRRGLRALGDAITSLGTAGQSLTMGGTSVAVPFVTGAIALLCSELPNTTANELKRALIRASAPARKSIVPPLLDVENTYHTLLNPLTVT